MSDLTILYSGVVCFGLMLLGVGLTVYEFRKKFSPAPGIPTVAQEPKP